MLLIRLGIKLFDFKIRFNSQNKKRIFKYILRLKFLKKLFEKCFLYLIITKIIDSFIPYFVKF